MRNRSKLMLAGLTAALALGAFVSAAPARRIALSGHQWRATWNKMRFVGSFATIECHVTIEGSFHSRTLPKVLEALFGYVSRVTVDSSNCTGGSARALTETLPWHIRFGGFSGTLPSIQSTTLRIVGGKFLAQTGSTTCLYASTASSPIKGIDNINTATGVVESLTSEEPTPIPLSSGSILCGTSARIGGGNSNSLTEGPGGPSITLKLVE